MTRAPALRCAEARARGSCYRSHEGTVSRGMRSALIFVITSLGVVQSAACSDDEPPVAIGHEWAVPLGTRSIAALALDGANRTTVLTTDRTSLSGPMLSPRILQFDGEGNALWDRVFPDVHGDAGDMDVMPDGSAIVITGWAIDSLDFGLGPAAVEPGIETRYVARLDASGAPQWVHVIEGAAAADAVAFDAAGTAYVGGARLSTEMDHHAMMLVAAIGADGSAGWEQQIGSGPGGAWALSAAIAPDGGVVIAGRYNGPTDLGTGMLPAPMAPFFEAVLVARFTAAGELQWTLGLAGATDRSNVLLNDLCLDASGAALVLIDAWEGSVVIPGGPSDQSGKILVKVAPTGEVVWAASMSANDGTARTGATAIACDASGSAVGGGITVPAGAADLGDAWRGEVDASGAAVWTETDPAPGQQIITLVSVDRAGAMYAVGSTDGTLQIAETSIAAGQFLARLLHE